MARHGFLLIMLLALVACMVQPVLEAQKSDAVAAEEDIRGKSSEIRRAHLASKLEAHGISDKQVIAAMRTVQRHEFVPKKYRDQAYEDHPLPIGLNQTISQPFIVAYMTEMLKLESGDRVLEIGTGSGYQAAVLAELAKEVYSIEILEPLAENAGKTLKRLGYENIFVRVGDGYKGWPEHAPFDAIIVTAAPDHIPQPLVEQLKVGGRLVIPVGKWNQRLILITKDENGVTEKKDLPVRFVPMTGEAQEKTD